MFNDDHLNIIKWHYQDMKTDVSRTKTRDKIATIIYNTQMISSSKKFTLESVET